MIQRNYYIGNFYFKKLWLLSNLGVLPQHPIMVLLHKCTGCLYNAMTKHPWWTKSPSNCGSLRKVLEPGVCVSVDNIKYSTPGFINQINFNTTRKRYHYSTIFIDHYNDIIYFFYRGTLPQMIRSKQRVLLRYTEIHVGW